MSAPDFCSIALADPFDGQLMRALEALSSQLQRGDTWPGHAQRLAELERAAEQRTRERADDEDKAHALMGLLREAGFGGAGDTYEAVENSMIDRVLHRGHGLPILLSALAIHLAERCGLGLQGIGFPGHFIVGIGLEGPAPMIFDPFGGGAVLDLSTLAHLHARATGQQVTASAAMLPGALRPTGVVSILVRVCNNLRHHYQLRGAHDRAAEVMDLLVALRPREVELRRIASDLERRVRTLN